MDAVSAAGSNLELVSFTQDEIDKITAANSWIVKATIPGGTYTGYDEDILTLAHNGFLCATADFPENDAYLLTRRLSPTSIGCARLMLVWIAMRRRTPTRLRCPPACPCTTVPCVLFRNSA